MSMGRLASVDMSLPYNILYSIHADWDPWGSIYRVVLGLATAMQGVLGIMIFLSRFRFKKKRATSFPSPDQTYELKKEVSMGTLSFAADIRPLFRSYDIASMKPAGVDLSSYEDVKSALRSYMPGFLPKTCRAMGRGAMTLCENSRNGWRAVWSREFQ